MRITEALPILRNPLFNPLRNLYLKSSLRDRWNARFGTVGSFYRQFVHRGSLVFDIGANVGEYSRICLCLGAKVVAVEPTPELAAQLRKKRGLIVEARAVGEKPGIIPLTISDQSHLNSLNPNWAQETAAGPIHTRTVDVEVTTLDALISKYGMPEFVKIDVEGYELQVLRGMSRTPRYLSFEFHADMIDNTAACLERFPDGRFNYCLNEPSQFVFREWLSAVQIREHLQTLPKSRAIYGDIFVVHQLNLQ